MAEPLSVRDVDPTAWAAREAEPQAGSPAWVAGSGSAATDPGDGPTAGQDARTGPEPGAGCPGAAPAAGAAVSMGSARNAGSGAGPAAGAGSAWEAGSGGGPDAGREFRWRPGRALDIRRTLGPLFRGAGDPAHRVDADGVCWRAAVTPAGPATLALRRVADEVRATAWGAGAEWALAGVPDLLGARDDPAGFAPAHPLLAEALRRNPGLRLTRTGLVFDQVLPAILEQKVTGQEARRSYRELLRRYGTPPPGPAPSGLRMPPTAAAVLAIPTWGWHRAGVDLPRQRALRAAATVAARLEECTALDGPAALARLQAVPGIGPWTAAEVAQRALGDADAVSVGDYHIPGLVGWALLGRPLDDDGMLAVLAEYRPHRHRVVRLIEVSGFRKPRFGPRMSVRDYRHI